MVGPDSDPLPTRPPTSGDLRRVCQTLNTEGARYLIIGRIAVLYHGLARATARVSLSRFQPFARFWPPNRPPTLHSTFRIPHWAPPFFFRSPHRGVRIVHCEMEQGDCGCESGKAN